MFSPDHFDKAYYENNGQLGDRPALRFYTRLARRYLAGGPYLDFGCGTGFLVKHLSTLGPAFGFEISEYSAAAARETSIGSTIYTTLDSIPDDTFSSLSAVHVMEHLTDDLSDQAIATWTRVLKPGGRMLVVIPDPAGRARRLAQQDWNGFSDETHINLKPHAEWKAYFERAGVTILKDGSDGMWNVPYSKRPKLVDAAIYAGPALLQFASGRLFLRPGSGESSIFVLAKD